MGSTYAAIGPRPPAVLRASRPLARSSSLSKPFTISGVQGEEYPSQRRPRNIFEPLNYYYYPWTYAPISKGSAVRSADHDRQTPRRPRISGLLVVSLSRTQRALSHCGHAPKCISHPQPRSVAPGIAHNPASRAIAH